MAAELDGVVEVDAHLLPLGKLVGHIGQRAQRRAVQLLEELSARLFVHAHRTSIQLLQQPPKELGETEADHVPQPRQTPPAAFLHGDLDLGLVRRARSRRHQHRAVVLGEPGRFMANERNSSIRFVGVALPGTRLR